MKKAYLLGIIFLFLVVFSPNVFAITFNGTTATSERHVLSSNSAFGNIVEREVNYTPTGSEPSWSAILFSWGGPLANGTGVIDIATAGFGVSAVGDILVLTMGPELEDEEPVVEEEEEEEIIEEEGGNIPSSGGGGGGSSSRDTYGLVLGDKVTVLIDGESHTIEITEVRETSAVLTIESTAQVIELDVGETIEIDLDGDGIADMAITLDAVSELRRITITVEDLTAREEVETEVVEEESIFAEPLERITGAVAAMDIDAEALKQVKEEVQETTSTIIKYVLLINLLIGALLGTIIAAREMHRRRIYRFFHQRSREDIVREKLIELEKYVHKAYEEGLSFDEIKEALLEAGWYEYEVDEVVTNVMFKKESSLVIK